jgi:hypothetical protein
MTSPIQQQPRHTAPNVRRDWCCGTPISGPHTPGCAYEPREDDNIYGNPVVVTEPEPPPAPDPASPGSAPAASVVPEARSYGFSEPEEFDFCTPNGDWVRLRRLRRTQILKMRLHDAFDSFSAELLQGVEDTEEVLSELADLAGTDVFDRVLVAASVIPELKLGDPKLERIELEDKIAIFGAVMPQEFQQAALEAQQDALKSVRTEQADGVRGLRDGEDVRPEAQ